MTRYVALLRGINVGGIRIKMSDLAAVFTDLGFSDVITVLASGNVLFTTDPTETGELRARIESALRAEFRYEAYVFVLEQARITTIVDAYPFDETLTDRHPYVIFTADAAALDELWAVGDRLDPDIERIARGDGVLYWQVVKGSTLTSALGKHTGKAHLKATTTTRNLKTLRKLSR